MTVFSLTVLKFVFLGLLYVFVWRALRWVVGDLRAPRASKRGAASPVAAQPARRRTKVPAQLVVIDDRGKRGAAVPMTGTIQIGRAEACHVRLRRRVVRRGPGLDERHVRERAQGRRAGTPLAG